MTINNEKVFYEGGPANFDLVINLIAGCTLIGLPFTFGAIVRALWIRFKITNKRVSVTGGWLGKDKSQIAFSQIKEVRSIPRGLGSWGDMVLVMKDNARLEMRSVPRFRDTEKYIIDRINTQKPISTSNEVQGFAA